MRTKNLNRLYSITCTATLVFHVFNELQITEGIKVFHLFAVILFYLTFCMGVTKDKIYKSVIILILSTLFVSFVSPADDIISPAINFSIIIYATMGAKDCQDEHFLHILNLGIPVALAGLIFHYFEEIEFRYQGYYSDPNYLCTTLVVFLFLILSEFNESKNSYIKIALIIEVIIIIFLVLTTLSRTGFLCTLLFLLSTLRSYFVRYKVRTIFAALLAIGALLYWNPEIINHTIEGFEARQNAASNDDVSSASNLRKDLSLSGIEYVVNNPLYLPAGIGIEGTHHRDKFSGMGSPLGNVRDHNTISSVLTEHGLLGFCCFFTILLSVFRKIRYFSDRGIEKQSKMTAFVVILIFSFSIYQIYYLPYWFILFYLSRNNQRFMQGINKI